MPIFIITVVVVVSLVVLAYPYFARRLDRGGMDDTADELAQRLRRARDRVYEEIRVLQQEYFLKTFSEDEYREQLRSARLRAAELMRQQQQVQQTLGDIGDAVEAELREAAGGIEEPSS